MPVIAKGDRVATVINVFTVATFDPGLYEVVEIFYPEEVKAKR